MEELPERGTGLKLGTARTGEERGRGQSLTEEERRARHKTIFEEENRYSLNFPEERTPLFGKKAYPTKMAIPSWDVIRRPPSIKVGPLALPSPFPRPAMVTNLKTDVIGDYDESGLCSAPSKPDAPVTLSFDEMKSYMAKIAPIEDPTIVEWMHWSAAETTICEMVAEEYKRAGCELEGVSDDPYIPGCRISDIKFKSEVGDTVARRGSGVMATPRGDLDVPVPGKITGIFEDLLCFGAITNAWLVQWIGSLLKWGELATNPQSRIRFPSFNGLVAPQFIGHEAGAAFPTNFVTMGISTDKAQTMKVKYREPSDYTQEITSLDIDLREGRNEVSYTLFMLFYVPTMVVELIPEDMTSTILDSYSVLVP